MKLLLLAIVAGMQLAIANTAVRKTVVRVQIGTKVDTYVYHNSNITLSCDYASGDNVWCAFQEYTGIKNMSEPETLFFWKPVNCTRNKKITLSSLLQINVKKANPVVWVYHNCSKTHTTIYYDTELPVFTSPENLFATNLEDNVTDKGDEPNWWHTMWFYLYSKMFKYQFVRNLPV